MEPNAGKEGKGQPRKLIQFKEYGENGCSHQYQLGRRKDQVGVSGHVDGDRASKLACLAHWHSGFPLRYQFAKDKCNSSFKRNCNWEEVCNWIPRSQVDIRHWKNLNGSRLWSQCCGGGIICSCKRIFSTPQGWAGTNSSGLHHSTLMSLEERLCFDPLPV